MCGDGGWWAGPRQVAGVHVEIALQWTSDSFTDSMVGFVNSIKTVDGGTHMEARPTPPFWPPSNARSRAPPLLPASKPALLPCQHSLRQPEYTLHAEWRVELTHCA